MPATLEVMSVPPAIVIVSVAIVAVALPESPATVLNNAT